MTAPERIWAFEDEGRGVPRSGIWIDEHSECPDGSPEYVLASTAREAALQYLSDTGQMMERIADLTAANTALVTECARLKAREVEAVEIIRCLLAWMPRKSPPIVRDARAYLAGGAE